MTGGFYALIDLMITIAGAYVVVQYVIMIKTRKLIPSMLLPKDIDVKKCNDTEGYIKFIGLRQLLFGLSAFACGVLGIIQDYTGIINGIASMAGTVIFLIFTVWYAYGMKKAMAQFWGRK